LFKNLKERKQLSLITHFRASICVILKPFTSLKKPVLEKDLMSASGFCNFDQVMDRDKMIRKYLISAFLLASFTVAAQKIEVTLGPNEMGEGQLWPITITVHNGHLKNYDKFPDIKGMRKRDESHRSSQSYINGQLSSYESRIMYYSAETKGTITVPSFTMTINNKTIRVPGKKITVKAFSNRRPQPNSQFPSTDPDGFFGNEEPEYVEVEDDAFLAVTTDKSEVYVGEGVNATLAFYRAETNRATLNFYDVSRQLTEILKKIKPNNCWEENFNIEDIDGERVTVNGKDYVRFKIYEAMFFPFNTDPIKFPPVSLEMLKLKVARRPSYYSPNTREGFKTFTSKPKTVLVKDLPPHPLRNSVAVGEYKLGEQIASTDIVTGESTAYEFNIFGEGNIASLPKPIVKADDAFEIYEPNVRQEISRSGNKIAGAKSFRYFMIPKEPGQYDLGNYFQWIYFSPGRKKYDTLYSELKVNITGESKKNEAIESYDPGNFYDGASVADNSLRQFEDTRWTKWLFQGFIALMVGTSAVLLFKK
jgi:hypothetical protein